MKVLHIELLREYIAEARNIWAPTIHPVLQGSLCLLFESTLIRLPASARTCTRDISCSARSPFWAVICQLSPSRPASRQDGLRAGQAPVDVIWVKGDTGAMSLQTTSRTSCKVCWHALLSLLSASSHSLLLDLRTYQFERSLTTKSSNPSCLMEVP